MTPAAVLVVSSCPRCGEHTAPITRGSDGRLACACGADEDVLVELALVEERISLSRAPLATLIDEAAQRMGSERRGLSDQICPICSTVDGDVLGQYSRGARSFLCSSCGTRLGETQYERRLEDFFEARRRAKREAREVLGLVGATR